MSALDEQTIPQYEGSVTGPEMDQALLDMANHTSERYANGKAGGVPVGPGEVGYQDNSEYFKNQAAAQASLAQAAAADAANSAQRAESAVPAGTDAAILWTRDQSTELTADDKAVARKNIMAGGSNPNLLDNPFFEVNQRGFSSGAILGSGQYTLDRWFAQTVAGSPTLTVSENGVTLNGGNLVFRQYFNGIPAPGKTVTVSAMLPDGTILSATGTCPTSFPSANTDYAVASNDAGSVRFAYNRNKNALMVQIYNDSTGSFTVKAVKLELGSVSTLANDVPPSYAEELAKCQRYFIRINATAANAPIGTAIGLSSAAGRLFIPTPVSMRKINPIISANTVGNFHLIGDSDITLVAVSSLGSEAIHENGVGLGFTAGAGTITNRKVYALTTQTAAGYIDISTDL